jgi:ribosomal protein S6--L-glutamate ligase
LGRFHTNVAQGGDVLHDDVPLHALVWVEWLTQQLGVNHAGFDVAEVDGHFYVFEFNRLFGNQGLREKGVHANQLIYEYLLQQAPSSRDPHIPRSAPKRRRAA